jgi:hypothetical protein
VFVLQGFVSVYRKANMSVTVPLYGASIAIEQATVSLYLREKALDAVQEQVVEDLNTALEQLTGRGILIGTDYETLHGLATELRAAGDLAENAAELAFAKRPPEDDDV